VGRDSKVVKAHAKSPRTIKSPKAEAEAGKGVKS
jgi:hypothetical protein